MCCKNQNPPIWAYWVHATWLPTERWSLNLHGHMTVQSFMELSILLVWKEKRITYWIWLNIIFLTLRDTCTPSSSATGSKALIKPHGSSQPVPTCIWKYNFVGNDYYSSFLQQSLGTSCASRTPSHWTHLSPKSCKGHPSPAGAAEGGAKGRYAPQGRRGNPWSGGLTPFNSLGNDSSEMGLLHLRTLGKTHLRSGRIHSVMEKRCVCGGKSLLNTLLA